jgi:phage baseplate assembly protein W
MARYIDIDLDFKPHPVTGDILKHKDERAVIASVANLLQTDFYSRLFQHNIGSNLRKILFEPIDIITGITLQDSILGCIREFEPRASVDAINVTPNYDEQRYDISLTISLVNLTNPVTINFFLERIR